MKVTIDSELTQEHCECLQPCSCTLAAIPASKQFYEGGGTAEIVHHADIRQKKGEAEMSQVDWLVQNANKLHPGEAVSIVTSGDIDALYIQLFALSLHWPRNENGIFHSPVYVVLQKARLQI